MTSEPTIVCPECSAAEIRLTESRAAPLIQTVRREYEAKLAQQEQSVAEREQELLTGPGFRHRAEAIVEKFSDMQADLDRERKSMTRLRAKREAQIQGVIESTVGMYGDLQGIAERALQEYRRIGTPLLESSPIDSDNRPNIREP